MTASLRPLDRARLPEWIDRSAGEYARDLIAMGRSEEWALRHAAEGMAESFPGGAPTPGHEVFDVVDDQGVAVGYLWIGPDTSGDDRSWWIWDVLIEPGHRGRGLGREAMRLAEEHARAQGAHSIGLNVFAFNATARGLYESLGYETTSVRMGKRLD
ncbi:ribosomal protein S18 acetylase RimI-like enzyme [Agromyces cerinus]|uniref:GNAT family N-acetyltransferase n=1 Tax=Agromyces cerinus TaxID=33878 RepID=UPI00195B778D|nr:GNAT family N-acetyltransferase [Agromyces cerinus]MBM7832661.1 ribosomal protein S18 acetylase RimI-like enzyme [Agromyces cerinus]